MFSPQHTIKPPTRNDSFWMVGPVYLNVNPQHVVYLPFSL